MCSRVLEEKPAAITSDVHRSQNLQLVLFPKHREKTLFPVPGSTFTTRPFLSALNKVDMTHRKFEEANFFLLSVGSLKGLPKSFAAVFGQTDCEHEFCDNMIMSRDALQTPRRLDIIAWMTSSSVKLYNNE